MVTFLSIREQARLRSDMVHSNFVSESELKLYVNSSVKELYDLLVSTYDDYYIKAPLEFTVTGTQDGYSLPTDFYKLRGLDRSIDSSGSASSWWTVDNFNFAERNRYNYQAALVRIFPLVKYRVFGSNLKLIPQTNAAGLYQLWYVPKCPELVADSDEFDGISGWEDYVVVDAAIKMLQKQEDDVSVLVAQKEALKMRIEAMAADRDAGTPERITDARYNNGIYGGGGVW